MLSLRKCLISWVTVLLVSFSMAASAVELLSDDRKVQEFSDDSNVITTPDTPFGNFLDNYQNTNISEAEFSGTGWGYGESDFFYYIAESIFDVTFGLDVETEFDLSGYFNGSPGNFGSAEVTVRLYDGAGISATNLIYSDSILADNDFVEGTFVFNQSLAPGTYRFVITTNITPGGFNTEANYDFTAILTEPFSDNDGDGVDDNVDNCTWVANTDQVDTDNDGYGNSCDADFNNDCIVNFNDVAAFSIEFLGTNPLFDLNGDGDVNFSDYSAVTDQFLQSPGPGSPSGLCEN